MTKPKCYTFCCSMKNVKSKSVGETISLFANCSLFTAEVAQWLERSPREREVVG